MLLNLGLLRQCELLFNRTVKKLPSFLFALCLLAGVTCASGTVVVVDQQNTLDGTTISVTTVGTGVGQSFTPTLAAIDAVDIPLSVSFNTFSITIRLDLFSGSGYGGDLLSSTSPILLGGGASLSTIHFTFPSLVTLIPQSIYTFRITLVNSAEAGGGYSILRSLSNPYPGGSEYSTGGTANISNDIVFSEGLSAVPEPSTSLLGLGGGGIFYLLCRRKRS